MRASLPTLSLVRHITICTNTGYQHSARRRCIQFVDAHAHETVEKINTRSAAEYVYSAERARERGRKLTRLTDGASTYIHSLHSLYSIALSLSRLRECLVNAKNFLTPLARVRQQQERRESAASSVVFVAALNPSPAEPWVLGGAGATNEHRVKIWCRGRELVATALAL